MNHGFKQPRNLVRACLAGLLCYFVLAGLAGAQSAYDELPVDAWWMRYEGASLEHSYSTVEAGYTSECFLYSGTVMNSYSYGVYTYSASLKKCQVFIRDDVGTSSFVLKGFIIRPQCLSGYTFTAYANTADSNPYTGLCKRPKCQTSSSSCFISSQTPISSIPASACIEGCVVAQALGSQQERYVAGAQTFYYEVLKAVTANRCYVAGGTTVVVCNSGPPSPQDPCSVPGASTTTSCGGGTGCPAGSTVLANGACTPNDSNAPCPAASYRVDGQGACIPYPGGAGSGGAGSGGGGAGTPGAGGASGSAGGAGGAGGAGSGTGGGGGGAGGQGGGGGSAGSGGSGGAGGAAGANGSDGAGGIAKDDVKCGTTGALCQTKFQEYLEYVKGVFDLTGSDAADATKGRAEVAASAGGLLR